MHLSLYMRNDPFCQHSISRINHLKMLILADNAHFVRFAKVPYHFELSNVQSMHILTYIAAYMCDCGNSTIRASKEAEIAQAVQIVPLVARQTD